MVKRIGSDLGAVCGGMLSVVVSGDKNAAATMMMPNNVGQASRLSAARRAPQSEKPRNNLRGTPCAQGQARRRRDAPTLAALGGASPIARELQLRGVIGAR
jgi:hypothetical protein